jgi:hypothetical protein
MRRRTSLKRRTPPRRWMGLAFAVAAVVVLSCGAALATAGNRGERATHIDACLARHGWPYGYTALLHAEILHGHPNGLVRICGRQHQANG